MSCIGTITNNTNVKIKNENYVPLIKDIKNHNMKWQIGKFEDLDNIQMIFDYFGIVIYHNDLEGYVEINNARGCFYEEEYTDEVLQIIAKYIENGGILEKIIKIMAKKKDMFLKIKELKKWHKKLFGRRYNYEL